MQLKKRLILAGLALAAAALFLVSPGPAAAGGSGDSGNSNTGHLYLYEMTAYPGGAVVDGGAWAKLTYQYMDVAYQSPDNGSASALYSAGKGKGNQPDDTGDSVVYSGAQLTNLVFNAHGLDAGQTYYLIYSVGAAPAGPQGAWMELGSGQANGGGNLNINNSSLPTNALYDLLVWLVPASDWNQGALSNVNAKDYLYAQQLLFTDYGQ